MCNSIIKRRYEYFFLIKVISIIKKGYTYVSRYSDYKECVVCVGIGTCVGRGT